MAIPLDVGSSCSDSAILNYVPGSVRVNGDLRFIQVKAVREQQVRGNKIVAVVPSCAGGGALDFTFHAVGSYEIFAADFGPKHRFDCAPWCARVRIPVAPRT